MLGHGPVCSCPFCSCASRVTTLFEAGGAHPGFFNFACVKLRCLEAELRDELQRLGQGGPTVGAAAPPAGPIRGEGTVTSQPKEEEKTKEPELNLTAKTAPPQPPATLEKATPALPKVRPALLSLSPRNCPPRTAQWSLPAARKGQRKRRGAALGEREHLPDPEAATGRGENQRGAKGATQGADGTGAPETAAAEAKSAKAVPNGPLSPNFPPGTWGRSWRGDHVNLVIPHP